MGVPSNDTQGGRWVEYDVEFYQTEKGKVPVMDFLLSLQPKMRAKAYREIELLKKTWASTKRALCKTYKRE